MRFSGGIFGSLVLVFVIATGTLPRARAELEARGAGGGGDDIGNGGGLAEKNFLVALRSLAAYSSPCLTLEACRLSAEEKKVLGAIVAAMPAELQRPDLLNFRSGAAAPGFFLIDGELKVAKTGLRIGDPIFINTDLIYYKNHFGHDEAMPLTMALAVLIHELGHHVSAESHQQLDLLGVKVSSFLQNRTQTTPVLPWTNAIMATIVQAPNSASFPQILLTVGDSVADISKKFAASVYCPKFVIPIPILPFPDLQFGLVHPLGTLFHNVHWEKASTTSEDGDFVIVGSLMNTCQSDTNTLLAVNSFKARISFSVKKENGKTLSLLPNSVRVEQAYEPWYKFLRIPTM